MKHFKKLLCLVVFVTILVASWRFRKLGYDYGSRHKSSKITRWRQKAWKFFRRCTSFQKTSSLSNRNSKCTSSTGSQTSCCRQTWMHACKDDPSIVCRFFTDSISTINHKWKGKLIEEQSKHKDIEFMAVPRGLNFGLRMLWLIDWTISNYNFEFLLRLDDDYLVCLERLVRELEARKAQR